MDIIATPSSVSSVSSDPSPEQIQLFREQTTSWYSVVCRICGSSAISMIQDDHNALCYICLSAVPPLDFPPMSENSIPDEDDMPDLVQEIIPPTNTPNSPTEIYPTSVHTDPPPIFLAENYEATCPQCGGLSISNDHNVRTVVCGECAFYNEFRRMNSR